MDKDPIVIDNFLPKNVLEKIDVFYKTSSLKLCGRETNDSIFFLQSSIGIEELLGIFELDTYIEKYLKIANKNCSFKDLERFYLNVITDADVNKFGGHSDITENKLEKDEFYLVCLIFLNPEGNKDSGIYINEEYYEDIYNRMILFNGTNWHKPVAPQDNYVRITFYANFSNRSSKENIYRKFKNADTCSKYYKNVYRT